MVAVSSIIAADFECLSGHCHHGLPDRCFGEQAPREGPGVVVRSVQCAESFE